MVWIHGGAYNVGSGNDYVYWPLYYMSHDIVLVSIRWVEDGTMDIWTLSSLLSRYRLGPIGFLSLATEDVPGNAGVRDQVGASSVE